MTRREELKAVLTNAEAALADAVINAPTVDGVRAEAYANLEKARAYCRRAHAALIELDGSDPLDISGNGFDTLISQLGEVPERVATAIPHSTQLSEPAARSENKRSQDESTQQMPIHRSDFGSLAQTPSPRTAPARPPLLRQAVGFLALILAYLAYFHVDVQLQIVSLPSNFTLFLQ